MSVFEIRSIENGMKIVYHRNRAGIALQGEKMLCPVKYMSIDSFVDGLAAVRYKKNIFTKVQNGVINEKGEETLFSHEYILIKVLNRNMIAAKVPTGRDEFGWCLIKKSGERICQPKYDCFPDRIGNTQFWKAAVNGYFTLIDEKGHQLCKPIYDDIVWRDGCLQGLRDRYWYRMNNRGVETGYKTPKHYYTCSYV